MASRFFSNSEMARRFFRHLLSTVDRKILHMLLNINMQSFDMDAIL